MSKLYNSYWKYHKFEELPDFKYKWPTILKLLPKNKKINILDHGCGTGFVFERLAKLNPDSEIIGVDVSEYAIKIISKKFPKNEFFVVKDNGKLPTKTGSIDFIVSLDVIEHVYYTREVLNEFYRILSPKGKLLLTTPYHGLIKNIIITLVGFEQVFNPYGPHIRFFTKKSLFKGVREVGLELIKYGYYGRFYPVPRGLYILARKTKQNFAPKNSVYK